MKLKVGTRGSELALYQANLVVEKIHAADPSVECEIIKIKTSGDKITDRSLYDIGGKGLFLKEIEEALLDNSIDIAVHSTKDVPGFLPEGLTIDCYLEREDPRDVFISAKYNSIDDLPQGATVGTCAPRRYGQLKQIRPDLKFVTFRGNVPTRIKKVKDGEVDASILALSGVKRLGLEHEIKSIIPADILLPAVGQGAICIEQRREDDHIAEILAKINHQHTNEAVTLERKFLQIIDGNCTTPLAAWAKGSKVQLWLANDECTKFAAETVKISQISEVTIKMIKSLKNV